MGKTYGYIRVSTRDQNEARQVDALRDHGIPSNRLYLDKQSGKDFDRPAYQRLLGRLRPGDQVVVQSIDRFGRNYGEIIDEWRRITREIGADIRVLDMPLLDTARSKDLLGTLISDMVLQLLSFVAENERANIRQRQAEGIAAAKRRGTRFGRPPVPLPDNFRQVEAAWRAGRTSLAEALVQTGLKRSTFYLKSRQFGQK
jgi:DNA invertase Pin-like site-specific DNA recombinase